MTNETKEILKELREIKEDIGFIKAHIKDADILLTNDDIKSIKAAEKDLKVGKTKRLI